MLSCRAMDARMALREALDGGRAGVRFVCGFRHLLGRGPSCPRHTHHDTELVFHPSGRGSSGLADGSRVGFGPGAVLIYPPGHAHDQTLETPGTDLCLLITLPEGAPGCAGVLVSELADLQLRHAFEELSTAIRPEDPWRQAALDHRAASLLCGLVAQPVESGDHVALACACIARDYASIGSVGDVAKAIGISEPRLRHVFTARLGVGPGRWLTSVRCDRARDLLSRSRMPLADIAGACGFRSAKHLSDAFRRATGCAPMRWRRRHSPNAPYDG